MIDNIVLIILIIVVFIIIGVIAYLVYDFLNYKDSVDKSIEKTTENINKTYITNTSNIILQNEDVKGQVNIISDTLDNFFSTVNSNSILYTSNSDNFTENISKYIQFFNNDGETLMNNKMHEYILDPVKANIDLLQKVNTLSGITAVTDTTELINDKNVRICDTPVETTDTNGEVTVSKNCVNLNVNNGTFNLTPEAGVKSLNIFGSSDYIDPTTDGPSGQKLQMAKFDYINSSIYMGGDETNAGLLIIPNTNKNKYADVYAKDIKLIDGDFINKSTTPDDDTNTKFNDVKSLNYNYINDLNNLSYNIICNYSITESTVGDPTQPYILKLNFVSYNDIPQNSKITINFPPSSIKLNANLNGKASDNTPGNGVTDTDNIKFNNDTSIIVVNNKSSIDANKYVSIEISSAANNGIIQSETDVGNGVAMAVVTP